MPSAHRHPHALIALALAVSLVTLAPTIVSGFYTDDFILLAGLERPERATAEAPLRLYRLAGGPHLEEARSLGPLPWWTSDALRAEPLRPLSSALFALDHALSGREALAYHLHSLAWLALYVVLGARTLVRRLDAKSAVLAVLLFALAPSQVLAGGWIAARHALVSGCACLVALELAERGGRRVLELVLLVVALAAGESGVGGVLAVVAVHLVRRRNLASVAPHVVLLAAYVVLYRALDMGFHGSGEYVDLRDPLVLLRTLPSRLLALIGAGLVGAPSDLWLVSVEVQRALAISGALAASLFALALWGRGLTKELRDALVWLGCLSLALLPGSLGQLGDRVLLLPSLGVAEVVALAATQASARRALGVAVAVVHGLCVLLVRLQLSLGMSHAADAGRALGGALQGVTPRSDVVVLAAADPLAGVFHAVMRRALLPDAERSHHVLSMAAAEHRFVRRDAHTLAWSVAARIGSSPRERIFRSAPIEPGLVARTASFELHVDAVSERASSGVVRFDRALDDPSLFLLAWTERGLVRVEADALARGLVLPHVPGPQGL